ncbi:acrosin-binding protein-like [Lissotriton helveticus]
MKLYAGMGPDYWCSQLQFHGCIGPHVNKWLKKEYAYFQEGDYPDKVCDSEQYQHPSYCSFKHHQCQQRKFHANKVYRVGCMKDRKYRMIDEGYEEIQDFHRHIRLKALQRDRANNDAEIF